MPGLRRANNETHQGVNIKRNIRNPHRVLAALVLTLALAGLGVTIAPPQDGSAFARDAAHPQLALAVLPASAIDADALDQRPQPRLASCGEGKKGGFFSRLWRGIKNVLGRIGKWIRNHCGRAGAGFGCAGTF